MKLIPELLCTNLSKTKIFYVDLLGFTVKYERLKEKFIFFTREGIDLMIEEATGPGRRWITGELKQPFGRGINFQCEIVDVKGFFDRVKALSPESIYLDLEQKSYQCDSKFVEQTQFIVQDPDGYLFRFCSTIPVEHKNA